MDNEAKLQLLINELIKEVFEEGPVHIGAIRKGMEAGRRESERYAKAGSYRSRRGETFEDEIRRIRREQDQKRDMQKRIKSAGKHLEKVFGNKAKSYYMSAEVKLDDSHTVRVKIEPRESFAGSVFVVSLEKDRNPIRKEEFGIGIGAKQSIARYIKKLMQKLQS